ncbi:mechanosensitive ion channel family protein [Paenibacillus sp. 19GGS1-52]|uniref:mechanosensitive ion channel family protein n=1 Tax=Paenibacillus sp. 19GGS1-52 TaxID=2758563 RepID=UPI001EFB9A4F|nr:mechanosensitive ion channel family protein [Paenibacillus sp. 19GGS1-52]ULO05643.1 mechanosensitive ion channel family protein [Paenibacillus sp. 19GGS1-52]
MRIWEWVTEFHTQIGWTDLLISIGIMAVFLLFNKLLARYVFSFLIRKFSGSEKTIMWIQVFEKPLRSLLVLLGIYIGLEYVMPQQWENSFRLDSFFRSALIILIGSGLYSFFAQTSVFMNGIDRKIGKDDSSELIPFISKVLRVVVVVLSITLVGAEWGFSVNGLVAGMGLGSLAIALAAKESLGNIFGGIVIIVEKPFTKGDWILTPQAEGVVEDISFRSTRIRTFADAIVTVPNASIADQPITNWSRMGKRRVSFTLNVALDSDRERLLAVIEKIESILILEEEIDQNTIIVRFTDFNESSLGIFFYFFTKSTVWSEYLTTRQKFNFSVMRVLEEEGIRLAYPSQRIFLGDSLYSSSV